MKNYLKKQKNLLKEIKEYNLEESLKILNLLSDISFCQRGRGSVMKLFECMDYQLNKYSNMDTTRRKKSTDDFKKKYIISRVEDYDKMIKSYYSKKSYLKYFDQIGGIVFVQVLRWCRDY